MSDDRPPLKDGYEYAGPTGPEMRLIDPEVCPAGHPMMLIRRSWNHCPTHGHHNSWECACGQEVWRVDGTFVGERCQA